MRQLIKILIIFTVATTISLAANSREVLIAPPVATNLIAITNLKAIEMQEENWKCIIEYPNYEVSNLGRVKSIKTGRILSQRISNGYFRINLYNGYYRTYSVHRLMLIAFIGKQQDKPIVNHKNGIKTDNRLENIEWCTYSYNNQHAYNMGLKKGAWLNKFGENHHSSKRVWQFDINDKLVKEFVSTTEAFSITGINRTSISMVCHNKRKTAGGYKWKFKD